jgi:ADP-ribosyl-[dinitrogen reductase] hydrolase
MTTETIHGGRTITLADRLAGAVWGHVVGDAVGVPYEFKPASAIGEVRFGATGSHHQPPGTWSDDGALMLALLDSLLSVGFETEDQGRRAVEWFLHGAYTPDGKVFDIGNATSEALRALERGTPAEQAGPTHEHASGNGSLMRILPMALVDRDHSDAEIVAPTDRASRVTHGTPPARVACALYVLVARRLLTGADTRIARAQALADAKAALRNSYSAADGSVENLAALDALEAWTGRSGRGFVTDSFWSAWDAFAEAGSYRETIERAVAYGNDTDTTAAIAGGLAGIRWGIDGIPAEWLAGMRGHAIVAPLVDRLVDTAGYRTSTASPIRVNWVKLQAVPGLTAAHAVGGCLGMTFLPGKRHDGIAGRHWRDLEADAARLREEHGVDDLLLLVEDHELEESGVADIATTMASAGIVLHRHPIPDVGVPADPIVFRAVLDDMRRRLAHGRSVVVACRGGLGRTGIAVACLLRDAGLDAEAAIALTRGSRKDTIEKGAQERFVESWK